MIIRRADVEHIFTIFIVAAILFWTMTLIVWGRDDGRFADSPLKPWFDQLASKKGLCCSFADGVKVEDVNWDTQDGHYRVRLPSMIATQHGNGKQIVTKPDWVVVPDNAVITEPNRFGPAVVWPYVDADGSTQIRCFLPGAGT